MLSKRPRRSAFSDCGTDLKRFLRICLRSRIRLSSSALKFRFSCATIAPLTAAYWASSAEVGPGEETMPGSILPGGGMTSPGIGGGGSPKRGPPYPNVAGRRSRRTAGRPLSRIAFCGWKTVARTILFEPTALTRAMPSWAPEPASRFAPAAATTAQRVVRAHLSAKRGSIGLSFVAATNCAKHSATPMLDPTLSLVQWKRCDASWMIVWAWNSAWFLSATSVLAAATQKFRQRRTTVGTVWTQVGSMHVKAQVSGPHAVSPGLHGAG
jgi:hypothetical protein